MKSVLKLVLGSIAIMSGVVWSACGGGAVQEQPPITASVATSARWQLDINRVVDGVYRTYSRRCRDNVKRGHVVEFRNYNPEIAANITALASPKGALPLYSPNLVRPYNYETSAEESYSYWRYQFEVPGVYDFIDTNASEPGRKVVDAYYGTVTFVGIDPNSPFGTICVPNEVGTGCEGICCTNDADCSNGQKCFRTDLDAVGRCLTPSG